MPPWAAAFVVARAAEELPPVRCRFLFGRGATMACPSGMISKDCSAVVVGAARGGGWSGAG